MRIGLVKTFDLLPLLNNNLIANIAKSKAEQISFLNPIKCCVFHRPLPFTLYSFLFSFFFFLLFLSPTPSFNKGSRNPRLIGPQTALNLSRMKIYPACPVQSAIATV